MSLSPSPAGSTAVGAVDPTQDLRGWFYRAFAPSSACAVLEVGDANAGAWFSDVTRSDVLDAPSPATDGRFDMVLLHRTLGGGVTLAGALAGAHRALRPGGRLVLFGVNRLRPGDAGAAAQGVPRATGWGFRRALSRAGFVDVALYVAHPDRIDAVYMIDARPRSARAFFRSELAGRRLPARSLKRWTFAALVELGLMTWLQPGFIVVGRKC